MSDNCSEHPEEKNLYCSECVRILRRNTHNKEVMKTDAFASLLEEWLNTPFFETKEDWERWVKDFRPRVKRALKKYKNGIIFG